MPGHLRDLRGPSRTCPFRAAHPPIPRPSAATGSTYAVPPPRFCGAVPVVTTGLLGSVMREAREVTSPLLPNLPSSCHPTRKLADLCEWYQ